MSARAARQDGDASRQCICSGFLLACLMQVLGNWGLGTWCVGEEDGDKMGGPIGRGSRLCVRNGCIVRVRGCLVCIYP